MIPRQLHLFKSRRQRGEVLPLPLEVQTHIAVADTLRRFIKPDWWCSHLPSGELRTEATGKLLKRMGLVSGLADFMLLGSGVFFLELKRPPNKPTGAQKAFGKAAATAGAHYEIAYSYEEAIAILTRWGAIRVRLG